MLATCIDYLELRFKSQEIIDAGDMIILQAICMSDKQTAAMGN